jgi:hypothetical protein
MWQNAQLFAMHCKGEHNAQKTFFQPPPPPPPPPSEFRVTSGKLTLLAGLIALGLTLTGCPADPAGDPVPPITSIDELGTFLSEKADNTPTSPYSVTLKVSDLSGISSVLNKPGKYVNLNLTGSTFTSIGNGAFSNCTSLAGITIPAGVTSIGRGAFTGCPNLTSVTFSGTIASGSFDNEAFPGDLAAKYLIGGAGTYTRVGGSNTWTKKVNPPSGGGNTNPKKITITGITGSYDMAVVQIADFDGEGAIGTGRISNGSVTVDLMNYSMDPMDHEPTAWTGSGSYIIALYLGNFEGDDSDWMEWFRPTNAYLYTNGQSLAQLGITDYFDEGEEAMAKLPKFNISATVSTIALNKFVLVMGGGPDGP